MNCSLVIVFEVQIDDLIVFLVDTECNPPIARHCEAPEPAPISRELVRAPLRNGFQFIDVPMS